MNSNKVEYLLVGGHAVMYYGHPRNTADMDLWIAVDPANAGKVAQTLSDFGFKSGISAEMFLEDLKTNKRASVRPKDLSDLANLT